jgi:hypothetical protein
MKSARVMIAGLACLASAGCVAGPGGSSNAANRTIAGAAIGSLLGGVVGAATGSGAISGVAVGAFAGGALGAAVNPRALNGGTRGYCYTVDQQGRPIVVDLDEAACKAAGGAHSPQGR